MKNTLIIIGYVALGLAFNACSDESDADFGDLPEALVGSWASVEFTTSGCTDADDNGTCSVGCLSIAFTADGTFTGTMVNEIILGTVTANSNTLRLCDPTGDCTDITYTIDGSTVEVSWTDDEDGCTVSGTIIQPIFPTELVGTWVSASATATGCDDSSDDGTCSNDCLTYTFASSGAFNGTFADEPERTGFGYSNGSLLSLCWSGDFACQAVTYAIDGASGEVSWEDNEDGCSYMATISKQ